MRRKKYSVDENYFNVINTEDKAYFLGLMYADGYNCQDKGYMEIKLQEQDSHILEEFKLSIKAENPLNFRKISKYNPIYKDAYSLIIRSRQISEDLAKLGCVSRKSLILQFPSKEQVPDHLLRHFVRGMFDGDGNISIILQKAYKSNKPGKVTMVGTKKFPDLYSNIFSTIFFCEELQKRLMEMGINSCVHKKAKTSAFIAINGNVSGIKFLDWLYDGCKIRLNRKYEKYMFMKFLLLNKNYRFLDNIEPLLDFTGYY